MKTIRLTVLCALAVIVTATELTAQIRNRDRRRIGNRQIFPAQPVSPQAGPAAGGINQLAGNTLTTQFDRETEDHFEEKNLPGLVVLFARDGLLTYQKTLGMADIASGKKMSRHSVFRLASVSKWVAGILALKAEQDGHFQLKTKVRDYLPEIPAHHTYRALDLLRCRSGVRHYGEPTSDQSPSGWGNQNYPTALEAAQQFWHDPLAGYISDYHYSTHGYTILGACMENAVGQSIGQIVRNRLSIPYGVSTLRVEDRSQPNAHRVTLYRPVSTDNPTGGNAEATPDDISWKVLGGGLECSAYDLLKLGILLADNKILNRDNVERMMQRAEFDVSYAMGCNSAVENGHKVMAKNGGQLGASTYIWLVPEKRMCMVVLTNRQDAGGATELGKRLRNIALGTASVGSRKPDLVVRSFVRTAAPYFKDGKWQIPVRMTVKNTGAAGANVSFVNGVRIGTKYRWTGFMDPLSRSSERTADGVVRISDPSKLMAGRTLTLTAFADAPIAAADTSMSPNGRVAESGESNNTASLSVKLPGGIGGVTTGTTGSRGSAGVPPRRTPARTTPKRTPPNSRPADTRPRLRDRLRSRTTSGRGTN